MDAPSSLMQLGIPAGGEVGLDFATCLIAASGAAACAATVDALIAASIAYHQRSARRAQGRIAYLIGIKEQSGHAGRGLVRTVARRSARSRGGSERWQLLA